MARTIDERIVQMTFNNQEFEKRASTTMSTLDKLKGALNFAGLASSLTGLNKASKGIDMSGLINSLSQVGNGMTALEKIATGALFNIGQKISNTGIKMVKSLTVDNITASWSKYDAMIEAQQKIMSAVEGKVNTGRLNEILGTIKSGQIDTTVEEVRELYDSLVEMGEDDLASKLTRTYNTAEEAQKALTDIWDVYETGKPVHNLDSVIERIEKLRWYSDETSYSVDQMTNAIGNFTSAGVDLDTATTAIMGISNACGDAGISAGKAESAFSGFAKALGSGQMTLSVWNNQLKTSGLTNSERFKQSLIDAAEAEGTLVRVGDQLYTKDKKVKVGVDNLTDSLTKYGWANTNVMMKALESYSDTVDFLYDITEGGKGINLGAKVFDQFNDAMKEQGKTIEELGLSESYDTTSAAIRDLKKAYKELGLEVPKSLAAFARAQEAISFKQVIEATQTAVQSQFSTMYELIFGNYDEAKALWTDMANDLYEIFVTPLSKITNIFDAWKNVWKDIGEYDADPVNKKLTQTEALWAAIYSAFYKIKTDIFGDGEGTEGIWQRIFPAKDAEKLGLGLYNVIEKVRKGLEYFSLGLVQGEDGMLRLNNGLYVTFLKGFEAAGRVLKYIIELGKEFKVSFVDPLISMLKPILQDIYEIFGNLFDIISDTFAEATNDLTPFQKILKGVLDILRPAISLIGWVVKAIKDLTSQNSEITVFNSLFESVGKVFKFVGDTVKGSTGIFDTLGKIIDKVFEKIGGVVGAFLESHGNHIATAAGGGILGYIALSLSGIMKKFKAIDWSSVKDVPGLVGALQTALTGGEDEKETGGFLDDLKKNVLDIGSSIKGTFSQLTSSLKELTDAKIKTDTLKAIADSLLKLAGALLILSLIDADRLWPSILGLGLALSELIAAVAVSSLIDGQGLDGIGKTFDQLAAGLLVVSIALKIMASIKPEEFDTAIGALTISLSELGVFIAALAQFTKKVKPKQLTAIGKTMKSMGMGLIFIALALKIMSTISGEQFDSTLGLFIVTLASIGTYIGVLAQVTKSTKPATIRALGISMIGIGLGLIAVAGALKMIAQIKPDELGNAMFGLAGMLGAIGLFVAAISNFGGGGLSMLAIGTGLLIMGGALILFAGALALLGKIGWDSISTGLLALGLSLGGILIFTAIIGSALPIFLGVAAALAVFGLALGSVAAAILQFLTVYTLAKTIGPDFVTTILDIVEQVTAIIIGAIPEIIVGVLDAIAIFIPQIVNVGLKLIIALLTGIRDGIGDILSVTLEIIYKILEGLAAGLPRIVTMGLELIGNLIEGIGEGLPDLLDALFNLILDAVNGLANLIRNGGSELGSALGNLASALIEGLVGGIASFGGSFLGNLAEGGKNLWNGVVGFFGGSEADKGNKDAGKSMVEGLETGMKAQQSSLNTTAGNISLDATKAMDRFDDARISGQNVVNGLINGLNTSSNGMSTLTSLYSIGYDQGGEYLKGFDDSLKIKSPSRVMEQQGLYSIQGLLKGLSNDTEVSKAGLKVGEEVINSIRSAMSIAESIIDEVNPVITPVLDLSNVQANAGLVSSMLNSDIGLNGMRAANSFGFNSLNQNGVNSPGVVINFTVNNAGRDLSDADISRFGHQIAQVVNEELGGMVAFE